MTTRRQMLALAGALGTLKLCPALAQASATIAAQPYFANVKRAIESLARLGAPIAAEDARRIATLERAGDAAAVDSAEQLLEGYTLARLSLNWDRSVHVELGGARRTLVEQGWRMFLVRIANPGGYTQRAAFSTDDLAAPARMRPGGTGTRSRSQRAGLFDTVNTEPLIARMWLLAQLCDTSPVLSAGLEMPTILLTGLPIEYCVIQLFSRDQGQRRASLQFSVLSDSDKDSRDESAREFDFDCLRSRPITLGVLDADGRACVASLTIKDKAGRICPPMAMRIAPDMAFQPQVYRADGESVCLPDGEYLIESKRGPEYLSALQTIGIDESHTRIDVRLQRWIDPAKWGWFSGDTHLHAAGCAHYELPTEGVSPETMVRHVRGEGLAIGDVLTWGPGYYYQKQFFSGHAVSPAATLEHPKLQLANNANWQTRATPKDDETTLRYDMEISGFPSSHAGHLVLLRLREQSYPGAKLIEEWPSWNLPILRWAKSQGSIAGYAHCSSGLEVDSTELPNYEIPAFDSIGANECIIDVTHGAVDFMSGVNGPPAAELNAWYHILNCGFRLAMVGETDYPCIVPPDDGRPGIGRSYVRLEQRPVGDSGYNAWVENLQKGRLYYGDGRSHFLEFAVNRRSNGHDDLTLDAPQPVEVTATVAAWLASNPSSEALKVAKHEDWNIEHARIGNTREVPVELVVNGTAVQQLRIVADGTPRPIAFTAPIAQSSWIALRVMASAHTYPVFVGVRGKPIRTSKRSARWCRACVDKLWEVKSPFMRESERTAAAAAFEHARNVYDTITGECELD